MVIENAAGVTMEPRRAEPLDARTFAELVRPHMPFLKRLAARLSPESSPEDVVQDALLRAWRHRGRFDDDRGTFLNWLLAIVANEARRAARGRRWLPMRIVHGSSVNHDDRLDLERALRALAPRQKLAVDCFYFVGLSVSQTAVVMNCSEGTVKSTLADARRQLRRELGGQG